jgi:ParB-like chromosome segregation protein Spo0J
MKRESLAIVDIYVPVKRRATLDQKRVDEIATSMLDKGQQAPILVRADGARFVLVEGLHRLEAAKALGEKTISVSLSTRGGTNDSGG